MSQTRLFGPDCPKLRTIAPGAPFLADLARGLAEEVDLPNNRDGLADALIYLPNHRSARVLALALFEAAGETAFIPPDIRTLGDLESDDAPASADAALADLPPAIGQGERLGILAKLVRGFYKANGSSITAPSALAAARELARLLDQAALSGEVDWQKLPALVEDKQLAAHWDKSVKFLSIITDGWPGELIKANGMDAFERRLKVAQAVAQSWATAPPQTPVIIAGSTGATPASRILLQTASPTGPAHRHRPTASRVSDWCRNRSPRQPRPLTG